MCLPGWSGKNCDEVEVEEEDSPLEEFLEGLMELLDPNGPIATPVATIGVLGKLYFGATKLLVFCVQNCCDLL